MDYISRNLELEILAKTDVGKKRARNEDKFIHLSKSKSYGEMDGILGVADGMGGHAAGDVASRIAAETFEEVFSGNSTGRRQIKDVLNDTFSIANGKIVKQGKNNPAGSMGTTCTVAVFMGGECHIGHVGDSRAYLIRNGELKQLTDDHSWVAQLVKDGHISNEQARVHPNRNVITKALGIDNDVESDFIKLEIKSGDRLLICSDGLHGLVEDSTIRDICVNGSANEVVDQLIREANDNGGLDNITVAIALIK